MTKINDAEFSVACTGDVVTGDVILFTEAVFSGGSFGRFRRAPKFLGERRIAARVVRDSYGAAKQQHTFTIEIIASDGEQPLKGGEVTTRKGRNVYRNGTRRLPWADEKHRSAAADEKHERGDAARAEREARRADVAVRW